MVGVDDWPDERQGDSVGAEAEGAVAWDVYRWSVRKPGIRIIELSHVIQKVAWSSASRLH